MASKIASFFQIVLPKRRANEKGTAQTSTFNAQSPTQTLTLPTYREHLDDISTLRLSNDSKALLDQAMIHDPDISATVNAFLTVANTDPIIEAYTREGELDREGTQLAWDLIRAMEYRHDYSKGFELRQSLRAICENLRFWVLARGAVATEAIFTKEYVLREIRQVDPGTLEWFETAPGVYTPQQTPPGSSDPVDLNIPSFSVSFFRRSPNKIYTHSPFVSAINTIVARQQVINDLYRIMKRVGYGRIEVTVLEEVLRKNAPAEEQADETKMRTWLQARLQEITNQINNLRSDSALVHTDSMEFEILNEGGPSKSMDVNAIMDVLNAQNQAGLKVMSTIIGRGESGVNTASTETLIFSLNAQEINEPVAEILQKTLTMAVRLQGFDGYVRVRFKSIDLRPELELEAQKTMKQARLMNMLSHGLITDDTFHMEMFGHLRPESIPELSGTGFESSVPDTTDAANSDDPMNRTLKPKDSESAKSNTVKKTG